MKIAHFKEAANGYFNVFPVYPDEKSDFYDSFSKEWDEVHETIRIHQPFIAEEVYEQTAKLVEISLHVLAEYKNPITADQDKLKKTRDMVFEICEDIGKAIRKRIIV